MLADILPCLVTMNRVTYDLQFHAQGIKNDGSVIEVSVDEIADHVTKTNDENAKRAETVDKSIQQTVCPGCGSCPVQTNKIVATVLTVIGIILFVVTLLA